MRTIAHISDVHFGREDPVIVAGLLQAVTAARPDVIVVSGDLTQRAKKRQFRAARAFLQDLPQVPRLVVPGNHDVSVTSLMDRAFQPLARYKKFITADLAPFYADQELAIAGINTVRMITVKDGRVNVRQVKAACAQLENAAQEAARIIVTHHPIDVASEMNEQDVLARAKMAMRAFAQCRVDLFLSGHLHAARTISTSVRYKLKGYSAVVVHAGTAVSTRVRGEVNTWNLIHIDGVTATAGAIDVQPMLWRGVNFEPGVRERYGKSSAGWVLEAK